MWYYFIFNVQVMLIQSSIVMFESILFWVQSKIKYIIIQVKLGTSRTI